MSYALRGHRRSGKQTRISQAMGGFASIDAAVQSAQLLLRTSEELSHMSVVDEATGEMVKEVHRPPRASA